MKGGRKIASLDDHVRDEQPVDQDAPLSPRVGPVLSARSMQPRWKTWCPDMRGRSSAFCPGFAGARRSRRMTCRSAFRLPGPHARLDHRTSRALLPRATTLQAGSSSATQAGQPVVPRSPTSGPPPRGPLAVFAAFPRARPRAGVCKDRVSAGDATVFRLNANWRSQVRGAVGAAPLTLCLPIGQPRVW